MSGQYPPPPPPLPPPRPPFQAPTTSTTPRTRPNRSGLGRNPVLSSAASQRPVPPRGHFAIGLELELLFDARWDKLRSLEDISSFRRLMANEYNATVEKGYPRLVA